MWGGGGEGGGRTRVDFEALGIHILVNHVGLQPDRPLFDHRRLERRHLHPTTAEIRQLRPSYPSRQSPVYKQVDYLTRGGSDQRHGLFAGQPMLSCSPIGRSLITGVWNGATCTPHPLR